MFIIFEGHDGVGKSTISNEVANFFKKNSYKVLQLKNPDSCFNKIRNIIDPQQNIKLSFQFYLMASLDSLIKAQINIKKFDFIILDRYFYSTIVSHTIKGYKIPEQIKLLFPEPDLAFWIQVDEKIRYHRMQIRDKSEQKEHDQQTIDLEIIEKADNIYNTFNMIIINNTGDISLSVDKIVRHIKRKLES